MRTEKELLRRYIHNDSPIFAIEYETEDGKINRSPMFMIDDLYTMGKLKELHGDKWEDI